MAQKPTTVDEYLAAQPKRAQVSLRRVRQIVRKAIPGADEVISYGIPAFTLGDRTILYLAGWKDHDSLYPSSLKLERALHKELEPYELSHKGTIRLPLDEPVPATLIEKIAEFRLKEAAARSRATSTSRGTRKP